MRLQPFNLVLTRRYRIRHFSLDGNVINEWVTDNFTLRGALISFNQLGHKLPTVIGGSIEIAPITDENGNALS